MSLLNSATDGMVSDVLIPWSSQAVADHLPTAALKPVPGENHSTTPDVLATALREFVKESALA